MNKNDRWKFIFVIAVVVWSLLQMNPPTSRDLIQQFAARAEEPDATFSNIVQQAEALQKTETNSEFAILRQAIGTNDVRLYFPFIDVKADPHPTTAILNQLQRDASGKIKLGLDLQGGTSFLLEMDTNYLDTAEGATNNQINHAADVNGALSQAVEVLRKRVDALGVAEPVIQPEGENYILVQLPGLAESVKDEARAKLQESAYLEFRMVNDDSEAILQNHEPIPPGYEVLQSLEMEPGQTVPEHLVVKKKAEDGLAGDFVKGARVIPGSFGEPQIDFTLTADGATRFARVTTEYGPDAQTGRRHRMAIILDGELYSAPSIDEPIVNGECQITGHFSDQEAQGIASVLENPLRAPLHIVSSYDVGATLGRDSIHSGIWASIWAIVGVSAFMLLYYRVAGLTANIALITNVIILMGVMCSIGATLTLPGIAGIVLTIGMAVDANVLIYERLREELDKGKSLRGAIAAGYGRAFATIFDTHVTTLISSIILIFMGTGEIKGFGVTLTIGVSASLFTALVVTRLIFNFLLDREWLASLYMMHVIKSAKVNFLQIVTPLCIATCVFAIGAVIYGGVERGSQLFGVDFAGGDSTTFSFSQKVDEDKIRSALAAIGEKDVQIQYQTDASGGAQTLRVTSSAGSAKKIEQAMETGFSDAHFKTVAEQEVGAIVGAQIRQSAVIACMMAMFGILIYVAVRYEFSFALGAIAAVLHDIVLTIGCYCLANQVSGRQFNATVVAALLTIIGFSLNDKVVIFDRIRENLKLGARGTFKEIINQAINQTLSRTIITSGTVFLATLALYIWGGGEINDFAFTFLIGIITGTYSSIYIASAFVLWWHKGKAPTIGASQVAMQNNVPAVKV